MMRWFKPEEFRCHCCGGLPPAAMANVEALVERVLDRARDRYGGPVVVNSGYRCVRHNREVGGSAHSQHCCGNGSAAADVSAGSPGENLKLAAAIVRGGDWDQMILYVGRGDMRPRWVHVSWNRYGSNRREVRLHRQGAGASYPRLSAEELAVLLCE